MSLDRYSLSMKITQTITCFLLFAVLCLSAYLRFDGLNWGLPFRFHPDELKYVGGAAKVHQGQWNPNYFRNPPGYTYLNAAWHPLWLSVRQPVDVPRWLELDPVKLRLSTNIEAAYFYRPFDLVLGARVLTAALGVLSVLLIFFIGKRLGNEQTGLIAAWIAACSFLYVRDSHYAVNDVAMVFWVLLAFLAALWAYKSEIYWRWLVASLLAGIAVAFKYNAFPAVLMIAFLRWLIWREKEEKEPWIILVRDVSLFAGVSIFAFLLICPFPIIDPASFWSGVADQAKKNTAEWTGQKHIWSGFLLLETMYISEGLFTLALAGAGIYFSIGKKLWPLLIFPAIYLVLIVSHPLFFARFAIPLLPWTALCAALGIQALLEHFQFSKPVYILLIIVCALEPLSKDLRSNSLLKQEDTRVQCLRWFLAEEQESAFLALGMFGTSLVYRDVPSPWGTPLDPRLVMIDKTESDKLDVLNTSLKFPIHYVAMSSFDTFPGYLPDTFAQRRSAIQKFAGSAEPKLVFQPFTREWTPAESDIEDSYTPFRNLWGRERPGPVIEIYQKGK